MFYVLATETGKLSSTQVLFNTDAFGAILASAQVTTSLLLVHIETCGCGFGTRDTLLNLFHTRKTFIFTDDLWHGALSCLVNMFSILLMHFLPFSPNFAWYNWDQMLLIAGGFRWVYCCSSDHNESHLTS